MSQQSAPTTIEAVTGKPVSLPSGEFVANAAFEREGLDLHLTSPDGQTIIVENYFGQSPQPDIVTPDGARLSPEMVDAFVPPEHAGEYAENTAAQQMMSDSSPAGKITEVVGDATIVRADGTKVAATVGTPVYPGDVVQTTAKGAVNILFADNTTFAISENARMSVDEFTYSAADQSGHSFFSMLQGVFVYTSGLIGKNDPGNVNIETPVGSIGIRGTVVAGDIKPAGEESKITIVDGAIVLSNSTGTLELNNAFQTASVNGYNSPLSDIGRIDAHTFTTTYQAVSGVAAPTFDAIPNAAPSDKGNDGNTHTPGQNAAPDAPQNAPAENREKKSEAAPAGSQDATQTAATTPASDAKTDATATDASQPLATTAVSTTIVTAPTSTTTFTATGTTSFGGTGDFSATTSTDASSRSTFSATTAAATTTTVIAPLTVTTDATVAGTTTNTGTAATGGTYVPPPPPPPGVPDVHFNFMPIYTKNTAIIADDGIPLFGGVTNFSLTPTPILIGQVVASNLPNGSSVQVSGFDANGDIVGTILTINTGFNYNTSTTGPIFHYDASTGNVYLTNPLGISGMGLNSFSFAIVAKDALGQTIATNSTVVRFDVPPSVAGSFVLIGDDTNQVTGLTGTTASDLIFGLGGDDIISGGMGGADTLLGGLGNDTLWVATPGFNFVGGGVGEDTLVIGHPVFAKQIFDFTPANNVNNIEKILIKNSSSNNGNDIHLNIRDVFEMTDADHTLLIDRSGTGGGSVVNIDNSDTTLADFVQTAGTVGSGEIVYSGVFNGSTVTLVINQGTSPSTDGIAVNVMP